MATQDDLEILARIKSHPGLRERIKAILDIAENTSGELITADQAEGKAIEEVKKLGQELLKEWAVQQHEKAIETAKKTHPNAKKHEKKTLLAIDIRKNRNRRNSHENWKRKATAFFIER
jgi:hypothetical protein